MSGGAPLSAGPAGPAVSAGRQRLIVVAVCLGMAMSFVEVTAAIATLQPIQREYAVAPGDLSWVSSLYALVVAALVLSGGALGDRLGRRAVFLAGVGAMVAGDLVVATAGGFGQVLVGRAISGLGGALILPTSLAILVVTFANPAVRARMIAVWVSASGLGLALGPLLGALVVRGAGWHAAYLINLPVAVATVAVTWFAVTESRMPGRRLDVPGQLLAVAGLGSLVYGIAVGGRESYTEPMVAGALLLAVLCLAGFVLVERRRAAPMFDLALLREARPAVALLVAGIGLFGFVGVSYLQILYLQRVDGFDPLGAAVRLLALTLSFLVATVAVGALAGRIPAARLLLTGLLAAGAGALALLAEDPGSPYWRAALALGLTGLGCGLVVAPSTAAALAVVPPPRAPGASAAVTVFRQLGSVFGTAVLGAVLARRFAGELPDALRDAGVPAPAADAVTSAVASGRTGSSGNAAIGDAIDAAFTSGVHTALAVAAGTFLLGAALVAAVLLRPARPAQSPAPPISR
ncbi:MFS transporter [Actinoplanes octamycinicus]|nr:MFS transporter [Actinoplanes octamycinicus]